MDREVPMLTARFGLGLFVGCEGKSIRLLCKLAINQQLFVVADNVGQGPRSSISPRSAGAKAGSLFGNPLVQNR